VQKPKDYHLMFNLTCLGATDNYNPLILQGWWLNFNPVVVVVKKKKALFSQIDHTNAISL